MKLSAKAQAALGNMVQRFESGDISPIVEVARIRRDPSAPSYKWTFKNQVIAYAQTNTLDCRGYKQWQEAGRQVRKGENASFILGPVTIKKTRKDQDGEEEERSVCVGFHAIPVFSYHQTDGDQDTAIRYEPRQLPPLADVAENLGISIRFGPMLDALGSASVQGTRITLGSNDVRTFFHELAHCCHARIEGELNAGQDKEQETIAEFTACVLASMYGHDYTGNAWEYIKGYHEDPIQAIYTALGTIEQVLGVIEENAGEEVTR